MSDFDQINAPGAPFNEPSELFNNDDVQLGRRRIVQQIPSAVPQGAAPAPRSSRIRRQFGAIEDDVQAPTQTAIVAPPEVPERDLAGGFSLVRAARVAHQHRVGFWTEDGVTGYVGRTNKADPSEDALEQRYNDFLLFSYLPESLTPSRDAFEDQSKPQKRSQVLVAAQILMGVSTVNDDRRRAQLAALTEEAVAGQGTGRSGTTFLLPLADPTPFQERNFAVCDPSSPYRRSSGSLAFTAEQRRVI